MIPAPALWPGALWRAFAGTFAVFNDSRTWQLVSQNFQNNAGYVLPPQPTTVLARILLEAGICLTPATSIWDPRAWFAVFRYATSFGGTAPKLRLVAGAHQWDARLLGVLSEEVAVGITALLAREHLGVVHIADVLPLIVSGDVAYATPPVDPKRPELRPDYLCLNATNEALFIESKGAVGTPGNLTADIIKGKLQVRNVQSLRHQMRRVAGQPNGDRVVVATNICISGMHKRSETTTTVVDPIADHQPPPEDDLGDFAIRVAYSKVLNLAGLGGLADLLLVGGRSESLPPIVRTSPGAEFVLLGGFPLGGSLWLHRAVWTALWGGQSLAASLQGPLREIAALLPEALARPSVLLNNGVLLAM